MSSDGATYRVQHIIYIFPFFSCCIPLQLACQVHNWAQAVASAEAAGALAVVVFNDLDAMETARAWGRTVGERFCST